MRAFSRCGPYVASLFLVATTAQSPAPVPTEPPPPVCSPRSVTSTAIGPTVREIGPGRRIVAIVWHLSDHHTYVSQTGDEAATAGTKAMKASDELRPAGTKVQLCVSPGDTATYDYLIKTSDGDKRAAKRID